MRSLRSRWRAGSIPQILITLPVAHRRDRACSHALPGGNGAVQRPAVCLPVDPVCGILRLTAPHIRRTVQRTARCRNPAGSHALDCQVAPGSACHLPCHRYCPPLYGVAIDLGTTTVVGCLARLDTGAILATASSLNRQITYGEELLTRIGYSGSPAGLATLQRAAVSSINDIIETLARTAGISRTDILDTCIAGNTVMNHLLCGINPRYLELADAPVSRSPIQKTARDLGLAVHPDAGGTAFPMSAGSWGGCDRGHDYGRDAYV